MRSLFPLALACLLLSIGGCDTSASSCSDTFTPCGGTLVGTWSFDTGCNVSNLATMTCPSVTSTVSPAATGTYAFNGDGSYTLNLTVDETGSVVYPAACLSGISACSGLDSTTTAGALTLTTTCTGSVTSSCTCAASFTGTVMDTGTYTTAGTTFTTSSMITGQTSPAAGYCVKGSQLQLAGGVMGAGSAGVYTVFTGP